MFRLLVILASVTVLGAMLAAGTAFTATNTVPASRMDYNVFAINANALKPTQCAGLNLTNIVVGTSTNIDGTDANDLILGRAVVNKIDGRDGSDCILGGAGDDELRGRGTGNSVCIGGPGTDTFIDCGTTIQ